MSAVPQQAEEELVVGIVQGVVQKGADKFQVEVDVGQQNPRRLWTKDVNLVNQILALIGSQQTFLCGISHWTNAQNQPVRSLWINGVGPQAQAQPAWPTAPQAPTVVTPQATPMGPAAVVQQPVSHDEREARIHRQTASKVAAILISHFPAEERTEDNLLRIADRLVAYYEHGTPYPGTPSYDDGDPGPQGIPHTDADTPAW